MDETKLSIVGIVKKQSGYFIKNSEGREQPLNPETLDSDASGCVFCAVKGQDVPVVFDDVTKEKLIRFSKVREGYLGLVVKGLFYAFIAAVPTAVTETTKATKKTRKKKKSVQSKKKKKAKRK